ncbi:MAG TPA: DegT/DnrJ/EryC1/StrS family aminotransferase [Bryobacteraceae bacterium]|nr:DegT/DnrJ/EryC1/StrS family aminotransferase [Bryobacteraceae bacterium]
MPLPEVRYELEYGQGSCYGPEEEAAALEVIRAGATGYGPQNRAFERAFADYCGVRHALAVSSGTAALQLAAIAASIGPGDEVITTPLSWISTANGAALRGADVVFADIDPRTFTLDPEAVARKITPRTRAIIAVHLYGQCCDMDALRELASSHGILLIEDCAHAPGAEYRGRKAGSMGDLAIFSFGQQKNMGTLGEGGMVVTNDDAFCDRMRSYRWLCCRGYQVQGKYGEIDPERRPMGKRYWHLEFEDVGYNLRMTDVQAAVGLVQLRKLDALNARRVQIAAQLTGLLEGTPGLTLPYEAPGRKHVFHVYCVLLRPESGMSKEDFMWTLFEQKGVKPLNHYMPIHLTEAYRRRGHREGECPVAEALFPQYVSLPIHPRLTSEAVEYMARSVREVVEASPAALATAAGKRDFHL